MSDSRYNGWTNWETWLFKLWLENYEHMYHKIRELVIDSKDSIELANKLEDMAWKMQKNSIEHQSGFFADVTNKAIQAINYYELADAYINDLDNN